MKPSSYREQALDCCATCVHRIDIDGIPVDVCGFGEKLNKDSYQIALIEARRKVEADPRREFDECEFSNTWLRGRWVNSFDICDEFYA